MSDQFAEFCIYTIAHSKALAEGCTRGGPASFTEAKEWITGYGLWTKAQDSKRAMAVLLGDATDCSKLLYWGLLAKIEIAEGRTRYTVDSLRRINGQHSPQELVLRSTGRNIAPGFIRPYAICATPEFIGE